MRLCRIPENSIPQEAIAAALLQNNEKSYT
jgi:hypothetical protein